MPYLLLPEQAETENGGRIIEALSPAPPRRFKTMRSITGIKGENLAFMRLVPPLFIGNIVEALRQTPRLAPGARCAALAKAAGIFANDVLCGLTAGEYRHLTVATTGLPETVVEGAMRYIAEAMLFAGKMEHLGQMRPSSVKPGCEQGQRGCAQWVRKGDILAVVAPGNAPGVHALWPQAVALGYKVAVRPSEREPWTAQRLLAALAKAGLQDYAALAPADYDGAEALIKAADLALVYGGDDAVRRYAGRVNILVQGPGRSKILIGRDYPSEQVLPLIWESVTGLGGTACVCASSVLVEGDAQNLARDFYDFAKEKFADEAKRRQWSLQVSRQRFTQLMQLAEQSRGKLAGAVAYAENPDGSCAIMPLIRIAENIRDPLVHSELPVASAAFAPFNRETDLPFLGDTLVLTAASADESLIARLNEQPLIRNFYIGSVPTVWMRPHVPHDGFLSEFLMRTRGYKTAVIGETDLFSVSSAPM